MKDKKKIIHKTNKNLFKFEGDTMWQDKDGNVTLS
jgi:hypothetical protein